MQVECTVNNATAPAAAKQLIVDLSKRWSCCPILHYVGPQLAECNLLLKGRQTLTDLLPYYFMLSHSLPFVRITFPP